MQVTEKARRSTELPPMLLRTEMQYLQQTMMQPINCYKVTENAGMLRIITHSEAFSNV
jgi:hypothetical protein